MGSLHWPDGAVRPAFEWVPPLDGTVGPAAARFCEEIGFAPDPEQAFCLDLLFAVRAGRVAAREVVIICARQNLKSALLEMATLTWLFVVGVPRMVWSAHEASTAAGSYEHLIALIEQSPALKARLLSAPGSPGNQRIVVRHPRKSGAKCVCQFRTRTQTGARGLSAPRLILDEGFALTPAMMGSIVPLMSSFGDRGQMVVASSAGLAKSGVLRGYRDRGRAGGQPGMAYVEWCDDLPGDCARGPECSHARGVEGCRLDDPRRLQRANPALGRRITLEYLQDTERRALSPEEFGRERLGWWDEPDVTQAVVSPARWEELRGGVDEVDFAGDVVLAVDVSPSRSQASVVAGGLAADGRVLVEVTGRTGDDGLRHVDSRPGIEWVVDRVAAITAALEDEGRYPLVLMLAGSAAESLAPAMDKAGVRVELVPTKDFAHACVGWLDMVATGELVHIGQPELTTSVESLAAKDAFESLLTWARRKSSADITAAVAATLAAWWAKGRTGASVYEERGALEL